MDNSIEERTAAYKLAAEYYTQTATGSEHCGDWPERFEQIASVLTELSEQLQSNHPGIHTEFSDELSRYASFICEASEQLSDEPGSQESDFVPLDTISDGLEGISETLVRAASGLCVRVGEDPDGSVEKLKSEANDVVAMVSDVAFSFRVAALDLRNMIGVETATGMGFELPACRRPVACEAPTHAASSLKTETFEIRFESIDVKAIRRQLGELEELATGLSSSLSNIGGLLIAVGALASGVSYFEAYECWDQCGAQGFQGGNIIDIRAPLVATLTYQPEIDVEWVWCCWNWCWTLEWDKLIETEITTYPLGGLIKLPFGRPPGAALTAARQRARRVNLGALTPPATPC